MRSSALTLVAIAIAALAPQAAGAWAAAGSHRPTMHWTRPSVQSTTSPVSAVPAKPAGLTSSWLSTSLPYLGVGSVTAGLGYAAAALAGPAAAATLGLSVALPMAVSLVELIVFGGPRVARIMGGKPADAYLTQLVAGVAQRANLPPPAHVFEIETSEMNAFAAGLFSRDRTVAVTSGLRRTLTERELCAVIAHEMGHLRHADVARNMHLAAAAAGLGGLYQGGRALLRASSTKTGSKDKDKDKEGSAVALGLGLMAAGVVTQSAAHLLRLGLGRNAEFAADAVAAELYGADAIASALQKISRPGTKRDKLGARGNAFAHLYIAPEPEAARHVHTRPNAKRPWWRNWKSWLSTHPSTEERIEALQHFGQR